MVLKTSQTTLLVVVFLILSSTIILTSLYAVSDENFTRIRNSFLIEAAPIEDFLAKPSAMSPTFLQENMSAPRYLVDALNQIGVKRNHNSEDALNLALKISAHLIENKSRGKPIQSNVADAYRLIRDEGRGYCADYSQVFTAMALAANVPVREWGLGFEGFGGGHAFNEVFSEELNKWVMIDSFHSLYVKDAVTGAPLSTTEFQQRLLKADRASIVFQTIVADRFYFKTKDKAYEYYERGANFFYLFWGNNVFSYDESWPVKVVGPFSRSAEVLSAILFGYHPKLKTIVTPENETFIDKLEQINATLIAAFVLCLILTVYLFYQLFILVKKKLFS